MRIKTFAGTFLLGAACALVTANAISQQDHPHDHPGQDHPHDQPGQQMSPEEQAMMENWMEVATPGPQHAKLDYFVGKWNTSSKMWMAPGQPPSVEPGTATFQWTLGKRFLTQTYEGKLMGMPYEGTGLTGFDNYKNKWVATWAGNMGTNIQYMEGTIDQTGNVWTYFGTMDEWMTDEHDRAVKYVTRIVNDDRFVFEVHDLGIVPGETRVIEIEYTRAN